MNSVEAKTLIAEYLSRQGWSRKDGGKNTYFQKDRKRYRLSRTTVKPQVYIEGIGWSNAVPPAMSLIRVAQNLIAKGLVPASASGEDEV